MLIPLISAAIVIVILLVILIPLVQVMSPPENSPSKYFKKKLRGAKPGKVVVLVGDSITHGRMGFNYVSLLADKFDVEQYQLVNAGKNGELAWNVLQRVDDIIRCKPDIVTVMIGTNDAKGALTAKERNSSVRRMRLPREPDHDWFHENLLSFVEHLKKNTNARIALVSIPILGEVPEHPAFIQSREYSIIVQEIAKETGVTYLPFNERLIAHLEQHPSKPTHPFEKVNITIIKSMFKRYLLGRSWDDISQGEGFQLLTDHVHLNSKGAMIAASLIEDFILNEYRG